MDGGADIGGAHGATTAAATGTAATVAIYAQELVREGQEILRQVGIDPLFGKEVFVWAPLYAKGQHSPDTADDLVRELKALWDGGSRSRQKFADILKKHGEIVADRR